MVGISDSQDPYEMLNRNSAFHLAILGLHYLQKYLFMCFQKTTDKDILTVTLATKLNSNALDFVTRHLIG